MNEGEKYKQFRNYMCNELGITRRDIEVWTKESVATEVQKLVGQMPLASLVDDAVASTLHKAFTNSFGPNSLQNTVARKIVNRLQITVLKEMGDG